MAYIRKYPPPPPGLVHFLVPETTSLSKAVNVFYKYNGQVCGTLHGCLPFTWPDRGRFTVRANGKQKFKTEITCFIYQNTAVIKLVSKDDFEEMEHEFLIRTFCPEKLDYLLRCSVAPRNFR